MVCGYTASMSTDSAAAGHPSAAEHSLAPDARRPEPDDRIAGALGWLAQREAMVLLDERWIITGCSRGVAAVLGYEARDLVGQPVEALCVGIPDSLASLGRLRAWRGAQPFRDSAWMLRRDGLRLWAEMTCVADEAVDGPPPRYCLTVRDATLQYRASRSMRSQADAATAATQARNLFLGSIAHELRAALAPISTSALLLERQALEPGRHLRHLAIIRRNAATAARLLEDLLTFSTASENKLPLRLAETDLHALLAECVEAARQHPGAADLELVLEFAAPRLEARLRCDPDRIRQVLMNLLGNACKFTPAGGSVFVRTASVAEGFLIEVTDTGVGIDPAALPFIFNPFEQGGANVTSRYGGFGLGLAICAAIARQHGGSIAASSAGRGRGTTLRLCLPPGTSTEFRAPEPRSPAGLHVLYVEDSQDAADAMRYALGTLGWTMTHADTCASARDLVHQRAASFDVILADLGLPDGSGLELGSELCRQLPVVALSAYGAPMGMQGFADQLIKPAEIAEVQRSLLQAVSVRRASSAA